MNFIAEDFKGMRFNPMAVPEGKSYLYHYRELRRIYTREISAEINKIQSEEVYRLSQFVSLMYDPATPLRQITNYRTRKMEAMKLAKYPISKDGGFREPEKSQMGPNPFRDIFNMKNPAVNRCIVLFVKSFYSHAWMQLVALEEAYARNIQALMEGRGSDKSALEIVEGLEEKITALQERLFTEDHEEALSAEAMMVIEEESLGISPEDIAKRLKKGEYIKPYKAISTD